MADNEQFSENHIVGVAGGDDRNSSGSSPHKKQKLNEESDDTVEVEVEVEGEGEGERKRESEEEGEGEDGDEDEDEDEDEDLISDNDSYDSHEVFNISDEQWAKLKLEYCPEGVEEVDVDVWSKYLREIKESEGFDFDHYPGLCLMARYHPLSVGNNSSNLKYLIEHSNAAIINFNQMEHTNYKFEKVEKANSQLWDTGVNYYITFQAKDSVANTTNTFQALVWSGTNSCTSENSIVKFCRLKPAAAAAS